MRVVNGLFYSGGGEATTGLASDLLAGKKLNNEDGDSIIGTMPNNGAVGGTITQQAGKVVVPVGYTSGGQVEANISGLMAGNIKSGVNVGGVAGTFTADANAVATDILTTKTAYVQGNKITGSMANRGAITQTISTQGGQYTVPAGYHNGSGKVTASFANLVAANVRNGVNIGGVVGAFSSFSNIIFSGNLNCIPGTTEKPWSVIPEINVGVRPKIVLIKFQNGNTYFTAYAHNILIFDSSVLPGVNGGAGFQLHYDSNKRNVSIFRIDEAHYQEGEWYGINNNFSYGWYRASDNAMMYSGSDVITNTGTIALVLSNYSGTYTSVRGYRWTVWY